VDPDEDSLNPRKTDIEDIIKKRWFKCLQRSGRTALVGLATYWIKRAEFDRAKHTFEAGLSSVLTVRDFNQIFDSHSKFGLSFDGRTHEKL
jgi:pre-mRNA-splicing factor SYF1